MIGTVAVLFLGGATAARADEVEPERRREFVVLGAAALPDWEGSNDLRPVPLAVARFTTFGFGAEIEGLEGRLDLARNSPFRIGPTGRFVLPRNSAFSDDAAVRALPTVSSAFELGGFVGIALPIPQLREGVFRGTFSARQDVTGSHDGLNMTLDAEAFFALHRVFRMGLGVNASFATSEYMDTYFSVGADDVAASGLPEFEARGGARDVGGEVYTILSFHEHFALFSRFAYNRLIGDAEQSPIVRVAGSRDQVFVGAGVFWLFR